MGEPTSPIFVFYKVPELGDLPKFLQVFYMCGCRSGKEGGNSATNPRIILNLKPSSIGGYLFSLIK